MIIAIKDWLPITVRNRVALGFAFAALVMFVTWNLLPFYESEYTTNQKTHYEFKGLIFMGVWPEMVVPDNYLYVIRAPDVEGFLSVAASLALLLNGAIVLALAPLWKIFHASNYLRLPIAIVNLVGGLVVLKFFFESVFDEFDDSPLNDSAPYQNMTLFFIALTMLMIFVALLIFKNELSLRHDLEVKKMMGGGNEM